MNKFIYTGQDLKASDSSWSNGVPLEHWAP